MKVIIITSVSSASSLVGAHIEFDLSLEYVLVLEDSTTGATAALGAGIRVVKVSDPRIDEDSKRQATTCMNTLMNFKPELLEPPRFEDGPCVDTEKRYTGAALRLASQYGKQLTSELKLWVLGTPNTNTGRRVVEYHGLPITPDSFMEAKEPVCEEVLPIDELTPGADRIVRHLQANGIPMAVTTTSKRASFDLKMTRHQDLLTLFHHVVCSGGDPDVLVFENSPMGVEAALAAGMQVVMVSAPRVEEENPRHATVHLTSLLEFKPELFGLPSFPDSPKKK
ncbi:probable pseudouridine-5'-phosphatase [Dermacentor andersoni]|uniref:probable pseudouridine-5'-phosphatase n=1 Tax=Dermacentor andersoni TaxID=34620 RepID=UPI003B3A3C1B